MTTSGTYDFAPSLGELTLYSYFLAGVKPTALTAEHMFTSRMAANLMLSRWSNQGVNLWAVDLITTPLVQGTATYAVDPSTVMVLDAYLTITQNGVSTDRIIMPVSRSEYASYANKDQQGFSTVFWFDRLIAPTITLYPVPDGVSATSLKYYRVRQIQDANFTGGQNVEIPYRWLEAFADGMAYRLSQVWNPSIATMRKAVADESYSIAAFQDIEQAQQYFLPQIGGYFRP